MATFLHRVRLEIVSSPEFEAPPYVHQAWLNIEFDGYSGVETEEGEATQLISDKALPAFHNAFAVDQKYLLALIEKFSPDAHVWWKAKGFPQSAFFVFRQEECRLIRTTPHFPIKQAS